MGGKQQTADRGRGGREGPEGGMGGEEQGQGRDEVRGVEGGKTKCEGGGREK